MASVTAGPWWHAFGRVRNIAEPGEPAAEVWQLVVISPSLTPPKELPSLLSERTADSWGEYLTSWDHPPTDAEKEAVTPEGFRDEEDA